MAGRYVGSERSNWLAVRDVAYVLHYADVYFFR